MESGYLQEWLSQVKAHQFARILEDEDIENW